MECRAEDDLPSRGVPVKADYLSYPSKSSQEFLTEPEPGMPMTASEPTMAPEGEGPTPTHAAPPLYTTLALMLSPSRL
jgi:hypothetical protein